MAVTQAAYNPATVALTTLSGADDTVAAQILTQNVLKPTVTTAAALGAVGNAINTTGKVKGLLVEDENALWYYARAAAAAGVWGAIGDHSDITPA